MAAQKNSQDIFEMASNEINTITQQWLNRQLNFVRYCDNLEAIYARYGWTQERYTKEVERRMNKIK